MKPSLILLSVFPFVLNAADFGVSWSVSELVQPVELGPQEQNISALSHSAQFSYSTEDWLFGLALSKADTDDTQAARNRESEHDLSFDSREIFANYYRGNWAFSVALGESDIGYRMLNIRHMGANRMNLVDRRDLQEYDNTDKFYEFSAQYFVDLSETFEDLSINFEATATRYNTQGTQRAETVNVAVSDDPSLQRYLRDNQITLGVQNAGGYDIDESIWIYSLAANLDYSFVLLSKDWVASAWFERDTSSSSDGSFTVTRLRNNNRVISREFPLSESGAQTNIDDINSYGLDLSLALSNNWSSHISWLDSDLGQSQWQFGLSYWF